MTTVRIFFEKCGEAAYISLLDLQRVFHRMLKMSNLPVYYTQGFNPHIYLSFSIQLYTILTFRLLFSFHKLQVLHRLLQIHLQELSDSLLLPEAS